MYDERIYRAYEDTLHQLEDRIRSARAHGAMPSSDDYTAALDTRRRVLNDYAEYLMLYRMAGPPVSRRSRPGVAMVAGRLLPGWFFRALGDDALWDLVSVAEDEGWWAAAVQGLQLVMRFAGRRFHRCRVKGRASNSTGGDR